MMHLFVNAINVYMLNTNKVIQIKYDTHPFNKRYFTQLCVYQLLPHIQLIYKIYITHVHGLQGFNP
jgi:hypothetical protein